MTNTAIFLALSMAPERRTGSALGLDKPTSPRDTSTPLEDTNGVRPDSMAGRDTPSERPTGGDAGSPSAASTPRSGESRAARLAKLRQERSTQRISTALKGAVEREERADPAQRAAQVELLCTLRAEVTQSAEVINGLQQQIRQRDQDMQELGAHTASMQAQLAELLGQLDERSERLSGWSDSESEVRDSMSHMRLGQ